MKSKTVVFMVSNGVLFSFQVSPIVTIPNKLNHRQRKILKYYTLNKIFLIGVNQYFDDKK